MVTSTRSSLTRAQKILEVLAYGRHGSPRMDIWYHGGKVGDQAHKGLYITRNRSYAEKFAGQHRGNIKRYALSPHAKIYPKAFWWQDYNNIWAKDQMFGGYDAVKIIEPSLTKTIPSLVVLNPRIIREV